MKFKNYQEIYNELQACHGGKGDYNKLLNKLEQLEVNEGYGVWQADIFQNGPGNSFMCEILHFNYIERKIFVFRFCTNNTDTIEDDEVWNECTDFHIDFDAMAAKAAMLDNKLL